jgi:hypothetical protein
VKAAWVLSSVPRETYVITAVVPAIYYAAGTGTINVSRGTLMNEGLIDIMWSD